MAGWVARSLAAALVLGCTALLALTSTISTTVRLLSNAYVMDGTTFPTPSPGFVQAAINGFIVPTVGGSYTGIALTTPEQIVGINQSVRTGLADLQAAMAQQHQTDPGQPYVVFGYAQSAVIENLEKAELENQKAQGQPVANVTFVEIGDARPHLDRNASDAIPGAAASSTGPASDQPAPDPRRHVGPTPSGTQMLHTSSAPSGHGSASAAARASSSGSSPVSSPSKGSVHAGK